MKFYEPEPKLQVNYNIANAWHEVSKKVSKNETISMRCEVSEKKSKSSTIIPTNFTPTNEYVNLDFLVNITILIVNIFIIIAHIKLPTMSRGKNWCFTLNNYTPDDERRLSALNGTNDVSYLIYGRETGDTGTPHLQGFVSFGERKRMNQVVAVLGQCHVSLARHVPRSIEYCRKENDVVEFGVSPITNSTQGKRTDMEAFKDAVKGGMYTIDEIREHHSEIYARCPRFVYEYISQHKPPQEYPVHPLREWQQELNQTLNREADDRTITFVVDLTGNTGKSWFSHYYASLHQDVQVMLPSKKADMCYALDSTIRVLFVDAPRSKQGEYLQYDFLEDVKNGYVFSPKYESRHKRLAKCHVVVMMNEMPDMSKLSQDRYNIINI